jgi:hypothetical protein
MIIAVHNELAALVIVSITGIPQRAALCCSRLAVASRCSPVPRLATAGMLTGSFPRIGISPKSAFTRLAADSDVFEKVQMYVWIPGTPLAI